MLSDYMRGPFDYCLLALAIVVIPILSLLTGSQLARLKPGEDRLLRRYTFTLLRSSIIALLIIVGWSRTGRSFVSLGLGPVTYRGWIGFVIDIVLLGFFARQHIQLRKSSVTRLQQMQKQLEGMKIAPQTARELVLFCVVGIIGGIWEELLYRGFLIWFFLPAVGAFMAILCSSAIFGLGHCYQGWRNVIRTAIVGVGLAVCYVLTFSLWWLMISHAMMNIYGGLLSVRLQRLHLDQG
jgi:membrane protease YdiL (CAAX protease family)